MSSTSSSECVCGECFNYGQGLGSPGFRPRAPYYQTLGHPLIYYAQVQQTPNYRKNNKESRQSRPNCFVKAFRWYTQDHYPPQSRELPNDRTDLAGFASWLDKKYDQFMLDKRAEQKVFQVQPQRTSTLDTNQNSTSVVNLRVKKKFARVRSPWRKRRQGSSKDNGDVIEKCEQSFEFIMQPKELSRPASESCHHVSRNQSSMSTVIQVSKKTITKSQSSVRTDYERRNYMPIEAIKPEESSSKDTKLARSKSEIQPRFEPLVREMKDKICQCPEEKIESLDVEVQCWCTDDGQPRIESPLSHYDRNTNDMRETDRTEFSKVPTKVSDKDGSKPKKSTASNPLYNYAISETNISCQCSEIVVGKRDAQSQYIRNPQIDATCCCTIANDFKSLRRVSSSHQSKTQIFLPPCVKFLNSLEPQLPLVIKNEGTGTVKVTPKIVPLTFASEEAQTSNHSISFDKNTYPLFLKIVCADKLNEDFIRK